MRRFQHSQSQETVSSDMIESRIPFSESRKQRFDSPVSEPSPVCDFCDELDTWASSLERLEYNLGLVLCQAGTFFFFLDNREVLYLATNSLSSEPLKCRLLEAQDIVRNPMGLLYYFKLSRDECTLPIYCWTHIFNAWQSLGTGK